MNKIEKFFKQKPVNFLRLGVHAEQKYFLRNHECFSGIALNATIAAYTPNATGTFLSVSMAPYKPFFIDPLTYAFAKHPTYLLNNQGDMKRSIRKLVEFYGKPITKTLKKKALTPNDLNHNKTNEGFCCNVLQLQKDTLRNMLSADIKYLDISIDEINKKLIPLFVIPPYFHLDVTTWSTWLDINIKFFEIASRLEKEIPIFCEIVLSREMLQHKDILEKIVRRYKKTNCPGYLLWISNFPEHNVTTNELNEYKNFVASLSQTNTRVINLYGGYFSALLNFYGLSGFCHGPGYGEDRDVVPVGGGLPYPKFYFTPLHRRILAHNVDFYIKTNKVRYNEFRSRICDCNVCQEALNGSMSNFHRFTHMEQGRNAKGKLFSYMSESSKQLNVCHYLQARCKELTRVRTNSIRNLLNELKENKNTFEEDFGPDLVSHLCTWFDALSTAV